MQARLHSLIIKNFELACKLHEKFVAPKKITIRNGMALQNPNTSDQFTEIEPVFARQKVSE